MRSSVQELVSYLNQSVEYIWFSHLGWSKGLDIEG